MNRIKGNQLYLQTFPFEELTHPYTVFVALLTNHLYTYMKALPSKDETEAVDC